MIKERPILFSAPMVRALLDGTKTQTRRIGKCQNDSATELAVEYHLHATKGQQAVATYRAYPNGGSARHGLCTCPYGIPGDRLWVRETFGIYDGEATEHEGIPKQKPKGYHVVWAADCDAAVVKNFRFRPSIHMPRWASRILLEIVSIRMERLNDISEGDAKAEGISVWPESKAPAAINIYSLLWDEINGTGSWDTNPWAWVVEFKVITP